MSGCINEQIPIQERKCVISGNYIPPKENNHATIETLKKQRHMKLQRGMQTDLLQAVIELLEYLERKLYETWKRKRKT